MVYSKVYLSLLNLIKNKRLSFFDSGPDHVPYRGGISKCLFAGPAVQRTSSLLLSEDVEMLRLNSECYCVSGYVNKVTAI